MEKNTRNWISAGGAVLSKVFGFALVLSAFVGTMLGSSDGT